MSWDRSYTYFSCPKNQTDIKFLEKILMSKTLKISRNKLKVAQKVLFTLIVDPLYCLNYSKKSAKGIIFSISLIFILRT